MKDTHGDAILLSELSDAGVLRLTLNNPARRNALSENLLATIQSALDTAADDTACLLYTSPSPRDGLLSRMPSSA